MLVSIETDGDTMSRQLGLKVPKLTARQERDAYDTVTARDGGRCQRCGLSGPTDRDHRQGRDAWNTTPANLQLLGGAFGCGCHVWKTLNPADALASGFTVPRFADPAEWPAYRHGVGWVFYFDSPNERGEWWRQISTQEAHSILRYHGVTPI